MRSAEVNTGKNMKSEDFQLSVDELDKLNELIHSRTRQYHAAEGEPVNDVSVTFHFGPAGIRLVKVSVAGGVPVALDD